MEFPTEELKEWFLLNRRELPWRQNSTPYNVWISEIMLQQTQVSVVIPYFERWMQTFPTIDDLAKAPLEKVIKMWEGLGYYSRARNLHEAAQKIVKDHGGQLPSDSHLLAEIKGLGPYTCGAIRSFAFHQKAAAVDGNVIRVIARYFAIQEEVDIPKVLKEIWRKTEALLPEQEPWLVVEGLIELGATVCKKEPLCRACPLKPTCLAPRHGLQKELPRKKKKIKITQLTRIVAVIECEGSFLLKKGKKGKIMSDLFEFPYLDIQNSFFSENEVRQLFSNEFQRELSYSKTLSKQQHGFTRFRVELFPYFFTTQIKRAEEYWVKKESLLELPFSSGHRRILKTVLE